MPREFVRRTVISRTQRHILDLPASLSSYSLRSLSPLALLWHGGGGKEGKIWKSARFSGRVSLRRRILFGLPPTPVVYPWTFFHECLLENIHTKLIFESWCCKGQGPAVAGRLARALNNNNIHLTCTCVVIFVSPSISVMHTTLFIPFLSSYKYYTYIYI